MRDLGTGILLRERGAVPHTTCYQMHRECNAKGVLVLCKLIEMVMLSLFSPLVNV